MFSRNFTAKGKEKNWESWCLCKAVWVSVGFGSRTCQIMVAFYKMSEYSQFSSVQSLSHVRLCDPKDGCISGLPPCLSPTPGVYSSSCPSSRWCHPIISSSVIPVSSCLQSFPASGSFPMSQIFASGGQMIRFSASALVLPKNIQDWFPLGLTGLMSFQSKGIARVFSNTTVQKHKFFRAQPSLWSNSHIHTWLLKKPKLWLKDPLLAK